MRREESSNLNFQMENMFLIGQKIALRLTKFDGIKPLETSLQNNKNKKSKKSE